MVAVMKFRLPVIAAVFVFTITFITLYQASKVSSANVEHLVISEIKVRSILSANDEFIELYNPSLSTIDLTSWRLTKKPQDGSPETNLIASMSGTIPTHGFFLITHDQSPASASADLIYSSGVLADNNTISLYGSNGTTLVDKVGFGSASDSEATPAAQPSPGQSLERKANSTSTPDSMNTGVDELMGNSEDSDNNLNDLVVRENPQPQNSLSDKEPVSTPSPTPTETPTPTPTSTPSATPSFSPSASPSASPTSSPTASPSATPNPHPFSILRVSCSTQSITINFGFIKFTFPYFSCRLERI